ncbi:wd repeat-containing protein [Anaeramoeba ignava]|uniref:Wd repeat-containing protein n=1 Tax=Anaeramoeba ignava TaxID=1746090 RepID=A0A9Q0LEN8_ANAIG|nr:wd repeat-containing protein [Anaeramoeba ignava]|eukprot:Anaeramoba_ignava/a94205_20.p1 GENE.a94205_20~~a94205_20.p1  ORF type:complete len:495 (-),score=123.39 a94205_20:104-1588(-)
MTNNEMILSSSKEEIIIWEYQTGTNIKKYKSSGSFKCGFTDKQIYSIQSEKTNKITVWNIANNKPLFTSNLAEQATSLTIPDQAKEYCLIGGESGNIYIYHISTGRLLARFKLHIRKITQIKSAKFPNAYIIITTGEEGSICCWSLVEMISLSTSVMQESNSEIQSLIKPLRKWTQHTLPVSDIYISPNGRIYSASLDRTSKIFDIYTGDMLASIIFPSYLNRILVDNNERFLYVASGKGDVCQVSLCDDLQLGNKDITHSKITNSTFIKNSSVGPQSLTFLDSSTKQIFSGHKTSVSAMNCILDGSVLITGDLEGNVKIWDTFTKQCLNTFQKHNSQVNEIFLVNFVQKEINAELNTISQTKANSGNFAPIKPFKKHNQYEQDVKGMIPMFLPNQISCKIDNVIKNQNSQNQIHLIEQSYQELLHLKKLRSEIKESKPQAQNDSQVSENLSNDDIEEMKQKILRLEDENKRWKTLNNTLYQKLLSLEHSSKND